MDDHLLASNHSFDALLPKEVASKAEDLGRLKATMPFAQLIPLAVLAGAFISFGALFATVVTAGSATTFGVTRLLGGLVFSLGLVLVVGAGAELFTGNTLVVIAVASRRVTARQLLRNWATVFAGNFVGAIGIAFLVVQSGALESSKGAVGARALAIAQTKGALDLQKAFFSGILANMLVCLAVWLSFSARSLLDRIVAVMLPVSAFVAAGFEHSIANMYFFPVAIFEKAWAPSSFWTNTEQTSSTFDAVSWGHFAQNLLVVTLGNVIGGALLVGLVYWFVYRRTSVVAAQTPAK